MLHLMEDQPSVPAVGSSKLIRLPLGEREFRLLLILVLVTSYSLLFGGTKVVYHDHDSAEYLAAAIEIQNGSYFALSGGGSYAATVRTPGYPLFLVAALELTSDA